jgi:hypothetical protein
MSGVGFEPTIPALERANTVHALGRAASVIGMFDLNFSFYDEWSILVFLRNVR